MTMSDIIFRITSTSAYELAVEMYDQGGYRAEARYRDFSLGDAASNYTVRELPDMMSTKISYFFTPSPLVRIWI